jgi:hypothetical protein
MIVYITEWRTDLYIKDQRKTDTKIFYFQSNELIYVRPRIHKVLTLDYGNRIKIELKDDEVKPDPELDLQEAIMFDEETQVFIVLIERKFFETTKSFIESDVPKVPGLDIIFPDFIPHNEQKTENLFCYTSNKRIYPLHVRDVHFFKKLKLTERKTDLDLSFLKEKEIRN